MSLKEMIETRVILDAQIEAERAKAEVLRADAIELARKLIAQYGMKPEQIFTYEDALV